MVATTAAISCATSAGPSVAGSASTSTAAVQPTPSADRSCSTASAGPTDATVAVPSVAEVTCTAISTAHWSWSLVVKPTKRASTDWLSSVSSTSPETSGTRLTQTRTFDHHFIRSLVGSNSAVASTEPTVTG